MQVQALGLQQALAALGDQVVQTQWPQADPENQQVLEDQRWTPLLGPAASHNQTKSIFKVIFIQAARVHSLLLKLNQLNN